jgi:hypothetical protein
VERVIILFRVEPFTVEPMLSWKLYTKNGNQNHLVDITKTWSCWSCDHSW